MVATKHEVGEIRHAIIVRIAQQPAVNIDEARIMCGVEGVRNVVGHGRQQTSFLMPKPWIPPLSSTSCNSPGRPRPVE